MSHLLDNLREVLLDVAQMMELLSFLHARKSKIKLLLCTIKKH